MDYQEAVSYLFEWVIKNVNNEDMANIEVYFKKYTSFIEDRTFDAFKKTVVVGNLLGNELYLMRKKANVNYETPYYLSFMMKKDNQCIELPTIRLGIENKDNIKTAHILATQTSQNNINFDQYAELNNTFKKMLSKSKYFREFNPSHIISIILSFGILKGLGIEKVKVVEYFPLRFQRLVLENQKNNEELDRLQYRLTNKNIYNYLRICEFFDKIEIQDYSEMGNGLIMHLGDNIFSSNEFLQKLYTMGFSIGKANPTLETKTIKNKIS